MNFHFSFFRRPEPRPADHVVIRHVIATSRDNAAARRTQQFLHEALRAYVKSTTREERVAAAEAAARRVRG